MSCILEPKKKQSSKGEHVYHNQVKMPLFFFFTLQTRTVPKSFSAHRTAELASLLESAGSGEAFLTQANCSVITLGGSTSAERRELERDRSQE